MENSKDKKVKEEIPATEKVKAKSGEFGQKEAEKLAASYLPKGEKVPKEYKVMYVTSDKNVFLVHNEGAANTHARKRKLQVFTVKN